MRIYLGLFFIMTTFNVDAIRFNNAVLATALSSSLGGCYGAYKGAKAAYRAATKRR